MFYFFKKFLIASLLTFNLLFVACSSTNSRYDSSPKDMLCKIEYTGTSYAPFHSTKPYKFAIYDIDGNFISYLDTKNIITPNLTNYINKYVFVSGNFIKLDDNLILVANSLKLTK